jgi:Skp family chaperone for outer membrane proteins
MKTFRAFALVLGTTAAVTGMAAPAFAMTPQPPRTAETMKAKVDAKADHITAKLQAMQTKLIAKPKLAASRTLLQADITKALADTAAWRKQVDAATTKDGIRAADSAHRTVKADLVKLHADLTAAKGTKTAG